MMRLDSNANGSRKGASDFTDTSNDKWFKLLVAVNPVQNNLAVRPKMNITLALDRRKNKCSKSSSKHSSH